ncbi:oxidoreductase (plasmid) [Rhodococcus pyridinivorans SB3094]|uniref:Oxidoreductase n=1 Tax=Rhodococcus pyridinivorans SB3094 TaxID=1435356 RepID=V9XRW0_9NOCA|nr:MULTISPECIES: SDR family oxidoreductase [Rhodococcus]AHD24142.1 oxidoreductase [Rhodococcus pyridinivorans SB3094]AYA23267.1 SDR family oxidoreductase [Rhodococcus rhodochrous]
MTANVPERRSLRQTFAGRAALVTGAASGIGRATAGALLAAGIRTICLDLREPEPVPEVPENLQVRVSVDVTDGEALRVAIADSTGPDGLSYVVNCAGVLDDTGFTHVSRQAWLRCLEVNLIGAYNVIDAAGDLLRKSVAGAVVNVTSIEGSRVVALSNTDPTPQYAASKAGLQMMTQTAARALAADGVRVNSVSPGFVATPMALAASHEEMDVLPPALAPRVPLGRFARSEEIADAVAFLLSDQSSFITGADLRVDGGFALT